MRLRDLQEFMGDLLLQERGHQALRNDEAFQRFYEADPGKAFREIPRNRLSLYEELLFSSVEATLSTLYPYCKKVLANNGWKELAERYRRQYPNHSYQLYQAASQFPRFLSEQREILSELPLLPDLAQYEWLEVELLNAIASEHPGNRSVQPATEAAPLDELTPYLNPVLKILHCHYLVPQIIDALKASKAAQAADIIKDLFLTPRKTDILLYREVDTLQVRFFILDPLTCQLLQLSLSPLSYEQIFKMLYAELQHTQPISYEALVSEGLVFFQHCQQKGILLGSLPLSDKA